MLCPYTEVFQPIKETILRDQQVIETKYAVKKKEDTTRKGATQENQKNNIKLNAIKNSNQK